MAKIILTGDRPTGRLHIGHYVGSLKRRVELQNSGEYDKIYIMIADAQALTDNYDNPDKIRENIVEVALDYLSCGINPDVSTIFIQSMVPELTEFTFYYMNLVTEARLHRNPTIKSEIEMRGFGGSLPVGFLCYPISQASDITAFRATTVPAGEDQMPMIEQTREIVSKFNMIYGETLVEPQILLPSNKACLRLPGTDGKAKMSKSLGNCIYLADTEEDVRKKVMSMYTDPNHIRVEDPGQIEGNTVFTYLDAFCKEEYFAEFGPADEASIKATAANFIETQIIMNPDLSIGQLMHKGTYSREVTGLQPEQKFIVFGCCVYAINDFGNKIFNTSKRCERHSEIFVLYGNRILNSPVHSVES